MHHDVPCCIKCNFDVWLEEIQRSEARRVCCDLLSLSRPTHHGPFPFGLLNLTKLSVARDYISLESTNNGARRVRMGASKCALSTSGSFGIEQINFRTRNGSNLKFSRQFLAVLARRGSEACILLSMMRQCWLRDGYSRYVFNFPRY